MNSPPDIQSREQVLYTMHPTIRCSYIVYQDPEIGNIVLKFDESEWHERGTSRFVIAEFIHHEKHPIHEPPVVYEPTCFEIHEGDENPGYQGGMGNPTIRSRKNLRQQTVALYHVCACGLEVVFVQINDPIRRSFPGLVKQTNPRQERGNSGMYKVENFITAAEKYEASDIHLTTGEHPV